MRTDFILSQEFMECAHDLGKGMTFVCHQNAYLVAGFLRRRGHEAVEWVTGYYQCLDTHKRIHHSWLKLTVGGETAAIFEFDPRQLHEGAGYENDPMPSGYVPGFGITITPIATIVDPDLIDLPDEARESRFVVTSKEVLGRYIEDEDLVPDIDLSALDDLGLEAEAVFEMLRDMRNED